MYQVLQEEIKENKKHQSKLKKSGHTWKVSELGKRLWDDASTLINKAFAQQDNFAFFLNDDSEEILNVAKPKRAPRLKFNFNSSDSD